MAHISSVTIIHLSPAGCPFPHKIKIKTAMDAMPEYSLFLVRILEELDTKYSTVSYQDLCKSLCARFDLVHLASWGVCCSTQHAWIQLSPQPYSKTRWGARWRTNSPKKLMVARTLSLCLISSRWMEVWPKTSCQWVGDPSFTRTSPLSPVDLTRMCITSTIATGGTPHGHQGSSHLSEVTLPKSDCNNCQQLYQPQNPTSSWESPRIWNVGQHRWINYSICHSTPASVLLRARCRALTSPWTSTASQQRTRNLSTPTQGSRMFSCPVGEPFTVHSCVQKRNIFKEDFHNLAAFSPHVITKECRANPKLVASTTTGGSWASLPLSSITVSSCRTATLTLNHQLTHSKQITGEAWEPGWLASVHLLWTYNGLRVREQQEDFEQAWKTASLACQELESQYRRRSWLWEVLFKCKVVKDNHCHNMSTMETISTFRV